MSRNDRLRQLEAAQSSPAPAPAPANVIDFATNPAYLGLRLFPVQATLLKLLCLGLDLLTPYDLEVIQRWASGYSDTEHIDGRRWSGYSGIVPDVLERAEHCVRAGRWIWSEIVLVLGRRASKSLLASIVLAWQVWRLLQLGDPQRHFGLPPGKRIVLLAYGATRETATRDFIGDVIERICDSPCFAPYVDKVTASSVTLYTPAQLERGDKRARRGLVEISAVATRSTTARGPAAFGLTVDEAAHLDGAGSTSTTQEILNAARPALAQFNGYAVTILASSPWTMTGGFFESFRNACAIDPVSGKSAHPTRLAVQLPSWGLYEDYERAHELAMWPGGPRFDPIERPVIADDAALREIQRDNPEHFAVEYESQFNSGMGRYFTELSVGKLFGNWNPPQPASPGARQYVIHCDPSTSGANFAVAIGHLEVVDGEQHVVVDYLFVWRPEDFPDHRVHYDVVLKGLLELVEQYRPVSLFFDNHNVPFFLDLLAPEIRSRRIATTVAKVSHTQEEKFARFEHTKTLIDHGLVHAPPHPLAIQEARFIQINGTRIGHPTSGPCQTDDLIDAISWLVYHLKGPNGWVFAQFRATPAMPQPSAWGTNPIAWQFEALRGSGRPAAPRNPARGRWNR